MSVSGDAIVDEKLGLIYSVRVLMKSDSIDVDGRAVKLIPGMAVTSEVKTGYRKIIDYLLSPIKKSASEGIRER